MSTPVPASHLEKLSGVFGRVLSACLVATALGIAQQTPDLKGDYAGSLGPHPVKLHLIAGRDGALTGTVDSPDQGLLGIPCSEIHINGQTLSFAVPMAQGTWTGFIGGNGTSLSGTWNQGSPMPLNLTRITIMSTATSNSPPAQAGAVAPTGGAVPEKSFDDGGFRFNVNGVKYGSGFVGSVVVTELVTGQNQQVGTILLTPSGPNYDPLLQTSSPFAKRAKEVFEQHFGPASPTSPPVVEASPGSAEVSPPPATKTKFDPVSESIAAPSDDGMPVVFNSDKSVTVGGGNSPTFTVKHRKASVGGFFGKVASSQGGGVSAGGKSSLAGGGPVITMNGATVYDDMQGTVYVRQNEVAKMVAKQILSAAKRVEQEDPKHCDLLPRTILNEMKVLADLR